MYLRPENLGREFVIERKSQGINEVGRKVADFKPTGQRLLGVLAEAKTQEIERWNQLQHPITHTIVQQGARSLVQVGDRLTMAGRTFYVQGMDNIGALGLFTLIYAEERSDSHG